MRHSAGPSEVTLIPALDGASDYQQYLGKTSRSYSSIRSKRHRSGSLLNSPPPTATTLAPQEDSVLSSDNLAVRPVVTADPIYEEIKPARKRQVGKRRPHRVEAAEDPQEYPGPLALTALIIGICLSVFLVSLDRTIVATVSMS